jgi:hypothetical protein
MARKVDEYKKNSAYEFVLQNDQKFPPKVFDIFVQIFFISDFLPVIFDVFFLRKTDNFWQMSGKNRKSEKPALQCNSPRKVIF